MQASLRVLIFACAVAVFIPLLGARPQPAPVEDFPGWPTHFAGRPLRRLPLGATEKRFAMDFPGRIGRFSDGTREVVIRWVARETRMLHPASDCFRGTGYSITPQPLAVDADGARWGVFLARHGEERLEVRERIFDASGNQWTDVSAWFWAATTGKSRGPWWAVTTGRALPDAQEPVRRARWRAARAKVASGSSALGGTW